jgi:CheY-like chemotaxis protein
MSVVYGIVQRHGGRIEVDSTPEVGTTMRLVLPAMADADVARATETARGGRRPVSLAGAGPACRVLVIDDEPSVRSLLRDVLRAAGHEALEAASGREGLEIMATTGGIDLVLTDLGMPEMSGWEVARAVSERPSPPPVILVTGWGIQLDDRTLAASGVAAVVAKPFTVEEVLGAVERVVRKAA